MARSTSGEIEARRRASGLQRIGPLGHQIGAVSEGSSAGVPRRSRGRRPPFARAMTRERSHRRGTRANRWTSSRNSGRDGCPDTWTSTTCLRRAPRRRVHGHSCAHFEGVRYCSRPLPLRLSPSAARFTWDVCRTRTAVRGDGVAIPNAGTIPDRGLYGCFWPAQTAGSVASSTRRWSSNRSRRDVSAPRLTWRIEENHARSVLVSPRRDLARMRSGTGSAGAR